MCEIKLQWAEKRELTENVCDSRMVHETSQSYAVCTVNKKEESPANAKGTRDSSACMKAHCEQM